MLSLCSINEGITGFCRSGVLQKALQSHPGLRGTNPQESVREQDTRRHFLEKNPTTQPKLYQLLLALPVVYRAQVNPTPQ